MMKWLLMLSCARMRWITLPKSGATLSCSILVVCAIFSALMGMVSVTMSEVSALR